MIPGESGARGRSVGPRFVYLFLLVSLPVVVVAGLWTQWRAEPVAGQTIPWPTRTRTATPLGMVTNTPTWTPRPTWTRVPTQEPPTTNPTSEPVAPTATPMALVPSPTEMKLSSPSPAASAELRTPTKTLVPGPTLSPVSQQPQPLVFEVAVIPQVAGPGDVVSFIVQVANVGYDPLEGIRVVAIVGEVLSMEYAECGTCTIERSTDGATFLLGTLDPGEQVILPVKAQVVNDAWPGQLVSTEWTLRSPSQPAQVRIAELTLPWAPLPATGSSH